MKGNLQVEAGKIKMGIRTQKVVLILSQQIYPCKRNQAVAKFSGKLVISASLLMCL